MTVSFEDRQRLHKLCKCYLSGKWSQIIESDITIDLISSGKINKLYICSLPKTMSSDPNNKVVVRFANPGFDDIKSNTDVMAMNLILSAKGISPKILGVFNEGTIGQFIESRYFNFKDDLDPKRVEQLAGILAQFHSLEVPISKTKSFLSIYKPENPFCSLVVNSFNKLVVPEIEKCNYQTLARVNYVKEMDWLLNVIENLKCPLVFSHNDFNKMNILIKETQDSEEVQMFLIDFDWTSYNYRGVDHGQYFCSWGQTEPDFGSGDFPTDEQMSVFIDAYIQEMGKIEGESYAEEEVNSRHRLIKEAKVFALLAFMKDYMYFIWQTEQNKDILKKAELRMKCYVALKTRLLQEYQL